MELENRLVKLESKLIEMDQINLELQVKVCQQGDKIDYLMDIIKTKFGDDDFRLGEHGSNVSSLVEIVNQSTEIVNSDQDDGIQSESEAINDRSGEELNGDEHVAFEAVAEPIPGPSKGQQIQKKKNKRHTRQSRINATKVGFTLRNQEHTTTFVRSLTQPAEKRFVCDWEDCGKRYGRNAHLIVHKRIHTGEKPFACQWPNCGKRFPQKSSLTVHKRTHTGENKFKCPYCYRRFVTKERLDSHGH